MEENIILKSQLAQISTIQSHQNSSSSDNANQLNDTLNKENPKSRQSKARKDQTTIVSDAIDQGNGPKKKNKALFTLQFLTWVEPGLEIL